jgi:hypothetical protein
MMAEKDRHLNLFYSYNLSVQDELIENNLTRAFIQTLSLLSSENRNRFLKNLFGEKSELQNHDYSKALFVLQNYMDKEISREANKKYIVTIAEEPLDFVEKQTNEKNNDSKLEQSSIPDAWIYNNSEYCILIECKRGKSYDNKQIESHRKNWFCIYTPIIKLAWGDVLWAIHRMLNSEEAKNNLNYQERIVLEDLSEFINFYGYYIFTGFDFENIPEKPEFELK